MKRLQRIKNWLKPRVWITYGLTAALLCLSVALRLTMFPTLHGMPFLTFLPSLLIITWFGGRWPGTAGVGLAALLAARFLFPGQNHLVFPWSSSTVALVVFTVYALVVVWMLDGMLRAIAARDELLTTLEQRVAGRTAELSGANADLREEADGRRQAEERVAQYARLEALGQMVGGISHDFNNLLSIVTGNLDLAQRRLARGDVNIGMHIDAALEGARKGAVLTGRLLAFARKQNLQPTVTDVNGLIQGMVDMLGTTLGEHIIIDLDLAENLWPCRVDPAQLENAILNLAVNARDAMPAGGRLTLSTLNTDLAAAQGPEISDIEPGQYVTIVVSDSGTGMADDVMERAFEPFFTTKEVGHGTGLGLSQIHGLIKQSGGHVALSSKLGEGTSVRLYLPRHDGPAAASTAGRKKKAASPTPPKTVTVLVVEDEAGVRSVTCGMLADIGYRVLEASCGSEALALIEENPEVSVLLTDVVMPQMLGHELAEKALILRPALKVLYTSGYAYDAAVKAGQLREGANMLPKPFSPDQLAEKIDALLTAEAVDVH